MSYDEVTNKFFFIFIEDWKKARENKLKSWKERFFFFAFFSIEGGAWIKNLWLNDCNQLLR